jgi:hypothetical protein
MRFKSFMLAHVHPKTMRVPKISTCLRENIQSAIAAQIGEAMHIPANQMVTNISIRRW